MSSKVKTKIPWIQLKRLLKIERAAITGQSTIIANEMVQPIDMISKLEKILNSWLKEIKAAIEFRRLQEREFKNGVSNKMRKWTQYNLKILEKAIYILTASLINFYLSPSIERENI